VLVTCAGKHGSTSEIAAAVARGLAACDAGRASGLVASAVAVEQRPDPTRFDAAVLGSAVYVGRWRDEALTFGERAMVTAMRAPVGE
jgi:menaquinone-dependent protoporphyrinogen oxidase